MHASDPKQFLSRPPPEYSKLKNVCEKYPAIDNHAHPLLKAKHRSVFSFDSVISEAPGDALQDSAYTLASFRATLELGQLFGLGSDEVTWEEVKNVREKLDYDDLCRMCFETTSIQCILLDDGLEGVVELAEGYKWHNRLTNSPTKRIERIETVAEDILIKAIESFPSLPNNDIILQSFELKFIDFMDASAIDPEVVAFKSIACYRTGLDISTFDRNTTQEVEKAFNLVMQDYQKTGNGKIRLAHKAFNDHFVRITMTIAGKHDKPVQFHTGLGDPSLILSLSTPSLLQPLIRSYPNTKLVLLHASYPFTKEAGYLAAMYSNVYLDFGEVFPQVSAGGQRRILGECLELCPSNKLMWSTDGHWWPESYYLGTIQAREALYEVLNDCIGRREMNEKKAVEVVKAVLFGNSNRVYGLDLEPSWDESVGYKPKI